MPPSPVATPASWSWFGHISRIVTQPRQWLVVLLLACTHGVPAAELSFEYQLKAGFLFNFARFVEWPEAVLPPEAPLRLGVVSTDEIFAGISGAFDGKEVGGHTIMVERITQESATTNPPHMLFVQRGENTDWIAEVADLPVLIIGETPGFATSGGTIGFVFRGDRLRFQVNIAAANRAKLQLSSQLANYAEIVRPR